VPSNTAMARYWTPVVKRQDGGGINMHGAAEAKLVDWNLYGFVCHSCGREMARILAGNVFF
jgi:hypothetical protein